MLRRGGKDEWKKGGLQKRWIHHFPEGGDISRPGRQVSGRSRGESAFQREFSTQRGLCLLRGVAIKSTSFLEPRVFVENEGA